ncbi:phosphatidylinositol 3-kinase C2 domain-containing subunit gamma [Hyperolius riggenbachi]|uniref:phosphatidylinositol 3-kinase C2 domain-containing subunit gamma n=1 Tax=Hyperolius riggenbachi TaxID=752182 RepID=UPI0035A38F89
MDPRFSVGFSGQVFNFNHSGDDPRFPSPTYEMQNNGQSTDMYSRSFGAPSIGFHPQLTDVTNPPTSYHVPGTSGSFPTTGTPWSPYMPGTPGFSHMSGTQGSLYMSGTPGSSDIIGAPASSYMTDTPPISSYMAGTSAASSFMSYTSPASSYMTGTPPASSYMTGTPPASSYMTGTPPASSYMAGTPPASSYMTGTQPASSYMTGTAASGTMTGLPPPPVSYGFITNSWIEEQQSWYPEPSPVPFNDGATDTVVNSEMPHSSSFEGFRIGFENIVNFNDFDPTFHYHQIEYPGDPIPSRPLVRSQTMREDSWHPIGDLSNDEKSHARRFSLYDVHPRVPDYLGQTQITEYKIQLLETPVERSTALTKFCDAVKLIRNGFSAVNIITNPGRLWSVAISFPAEVDDSEVEMSIFIEDLGTPLQLLLRDSIIVQDLIAEILRRTHQSVEMSQLYPSLQMPFSSDSVTPTHQYLSQKENNRPQVLHYSQTQLAPQNEERTSLYPSLQECLPALQLPGSTPYSPHHHYTRQLLRICGRDEYLQSGFSLRSHLSLQRLSRIHLRLHKEGDVMPYPSLARTIEDDQKPLELSNRLEHQQYWVQFRKRLFIAVSHYEEQAQYFLYNQHAGISLLLEAVKEICYLLRSVETKMISDAILKVRSACYQPTQNWTNTAQLNNVAQETVVTLSHSLSHLINIYSLSFHTDFQAVVLGEVQRPIMAQEFLTFHLYAAHNLPDKWANSQNIFYMSCSVIYSGRKICPEVKSRNIASSQSLFSRLVWNEKITFHLPLAVLPYETMLVLRLCSVTDNTPQSSFLAWSCLPLYPDQQMVQGDLLLNMISHAEPPPIITPSSFNVNLPTLITAQVEFPETHHTYQKPSPLENSYTDQVAPVDSKRQLEFLAQRDSVLLLSEVDKQCLWHCRNCTNKPPNILPLLLGSAPGWDPQSVSCVYRLLQEWTFSHPLEGLGLLNPCFSDENIRDAAVQQLGKLSDDELIGFLPQLVQAVKFDWHLHSTLVKLLLRRSLQSIQIAHRLFWLITDATNESHYRGFYQTLQDALQLCVGSALNEEFSRQAKLMKILQNIGQKVKNAPEDKRQESLKSGLDELVNFFAEVKCCRLPLDPAIIVRGIARDLCSFFKSNAKPLKITFLNADPQGPNIHVIYKAGDDIRQDMLILQIIRFMDRIWLHEGLDLRMVTYNCLSTGHKQGLIEMVPDSTTLAKIQNSGGLFGPLKDTSIQKWFGSNKTASDNFLYSCAGWCVATFILGICDRHNDNIMLTDSGHMFHIDFGKILGNAQMFGSLKRDRAPFIFTSEMENFITQEGRSPQRAQEFVDLCCCAYNIIRKHSYLVINLLELMLQAGLPELSGIHDLKFVHENMRPHDSDLQATSYFTSKITESLQCISVKLNFLIHAFATMNPGDATKWAGPTNSSLPKLLRKTAAKSFKVINRMSEKIMTELGSPRDTLPAAMGGEHGIQVHFSFSAPIFSVLLKHLRNIYFPDGSVPSASVTISLHYHNREISRQKLKSQVRSPAPTFNKLVQFSVKQLDGYIMKFLVSSKGSSLGGLSLHLSSVQLNKDIWYRLG